MSLWGNKPSTPAPRPGMPAGPASKLPSKSAPKPAPKPGILGERGSASFQQMRGFVRKEPYAPAPGYGKRIGKQERIKTVETVRKYAGQMFHQYHGIANESQYNAILKRMEQDRRQARYKPGYVAKRKELDQAIKNLKAWKKTKA